MDKHKRNNIFFTLYLLSMSIHTMLINWVFVLRWRGKGESKGERHEEN